MLNFEMTLKQLGLESIKSNYMDALLIRHYNLFP